MNISFKKLFKNTLFFSIKKITFVVLLAIFISSISFFNTTNAATGVPTILHHQGRLLDASGNLLGGPSSTNNYCFKFSLYDSPSAGTGTKLWPSTAPSKMLTSVRNGVLNVDIGDTSAGGDTLDFDFTSTDTVYLKIEVAASISSSCASVTTFEELDPRQRVVAAGYAINSKTVGGFTPSSTPTANQIPVLNGSGNLSMAGLMASGGLSLTLGSDATGDTFYRNSSGNFDRLPIGSTGQALIVNGSGLPSWTTLTGGGNALTTNPLSQFAATTSAQLAGVISDETGSGALVFATAPTFDTTITLTTSPTASAGGYEILTRNTTSGVVEKVSSGTFLTGNQTITLSGDVTGSGATGITTTIGADAVALGTDTTGNYVATIADAGSGRITVTGSGSESAGVTLDITDDAVTFAKIQNITDNRLLGRSAGSSGDAQELTVGTGLSLSGGVLTSTITQYTNEDAQDAVGGALTSEFTYNDGANSIAINSINWSKLTGTPTTLSGYGITDSVSSTLADGKILIGNGSNVATAVTPSGDVTMSNTGVTTIGADTVVLGTDTTGNYVATVGSNTGISIQGSGSENAGVFVGLDFSSSLSGNHTLGVDEAKFGTSGIIFEGSSNDSIETYLAVTDPTTSDKTITFPDLTGTVALSANKLSFFSSTTSSELAGVISDETGSGALVFGTSPTIGTATLTNPSIDKISNLTGNGFVKTSGSDGTLSIDTNTYLTGNQTITLSGDVTGSGTTGITATIANDAVTFAKIQNITDNRLLGRSAGSSGDAQEITVGSGLSLSGGTLTATGTGVTDGDKGDITVSSSGSVWSIDSGVIGDTQLAFDTGQNLTSSSAVTFATVDTGQGANELYDMDQNVLTSSSVTFGGLTLSNLAGGGTQCLQVNNSGVLSATGSTCGTGGGGIASLTLAGTSGSNQTLADGDTITIAAGNGVTTTGGATDTVTVALDQSASLSGDHSLSANGSKFGLSGLIFEGSSADTSETYLAVTNPTADRTITFPDATGTIITTGNITDITGLTDSQISSLAWSKLTGTPTTFSGYGISDTSANLDTAITDDTGSGALVFGTSPTIGTATLTNPSIDKISNLTGNGFVKTSGGDGTLSIDTNTYLTAEADTLSSVTGRGATTSTASSFTGGATVRGLTIENSTSTDDQVVLSITSGGSAARFVGTITNADLTGNKTYTLPDATGTFITTGNISDISGLTDSQISNTLTASIFVGSGSTTNAIDLATAEVSGTLPVGNGGTGATTLTGLLLGNGTSAVTTVTDSSGIAGAISDETGTGSLVFSNSPTLVTPALGTPSAVVLTNATGTASGLTAGAVTNATFTTALTVNTGTVTLTGNAANTSVLTLGAGASSISGTNTGDNAVNSLYSSLVTNATHTGDATGSTALTVVGINGTLLSGLGTGILKNTTGTGVPSIAVAGDFPTLNQNTTGSAATLTTARSIYGNNFDGSAGLTGIIASTYGGTGNGFTKFSGPTTAEKTFTLPNASATILTDNSLVSIAQGGTGANTLNDLIALGTHTTGNYVSSITAGAGLTGTVASEGSTPTLAVVSGNGGIVVNTDDITLTLASSADGLSSSTSSGSGMEVLSSGLALLQGCANNEVLKWNETTDVWACGTAGGGAGLTDADYGDITVGGSGTTMAIDNNTITSGMITDDVVDFNDMADAMTLDASTSIGFGANAYNLTFTNNGTGDEIHNLTSTGDFVIKDSGTAIATFADTGAITFAPTTGGVKLTNNGVASTPALLANGSWFTGGSTATTRPQLLVEPSSGTTAGVWSTSGTGLGVNADDSFTGNLIDLQVGGASKFSVNSAGLLSVSSGLAFTSSNTTQTTTSSALVLNANSLTTGTGQYISSSSLTSGMLMELADTGTGATTTSAYSGSHKAIGINMTGTNGTASAFTYGLYVANSKAGTTSRNIGINSDSSGAGALYSNVPLRTIGHLGGGLIFGSKNSTEGSIWSNNTGIGSLSSSNYVFSSDGTSTVMNAVTNDVFRLGDSTQFTMTSPSILTFNQSNSGLSKIYVSGDGAGTSASGASGLFMGVQSGSSGSGSTFLTLGATGNMGNSTGLNRMVKIIGGFTGTSTATYTGLEWGPTINATSTGQTTGININPTLTSNAALNITGYGMSTTWANTSSSNAVFKGINFTNTINNTLTTSGAVATDIFINDTETSLTGTTHNFADFQIAGVSKFKVDNTGGIVSTGTNFAVDSSGNVDALGTLTSGSANTALTLSTGMIDADAITLASSGTTGSTSSRSGLQTQSDGLTLLQGCADNEILKWTDAGGWACSADTSGGSNGTIDDAYNNGSTVTVDVRDVVFNLTDSTNDYKVKIDNTSAGTIDAGLSFATSGGSVAITNAIDASDSDIVNAISIGANNITGTNFSVDGSTGIITSGSSSVALTNSSGYILHDSLVDCANGEILKWTTGGSRWNCATDSNTGSISADSLNFTDLSDTLNLDASTSIAFGGASNYALTFTNDGTSNEIHNLTSTGDLLIQDNGTAIATFSDTGAITFAPTAGQTLSINSGSTTGTTTSSAVALNANSLTTGTGLYVASSTLSSGVLVDLAVASTAAASGSQQVLRIATSGANATSTQNTYGLSINNTHTGTTSTNFGIYTAATSGTTNYGIYAVGSGGTTNYGGYFDGLVGLKAPSGSNTGNLRIFNSSGTEQFSIQGRSETGGISARACQDCSAPVFTTTSTGAIGFGSFANNPVGQVSIVVTPTATANNGLLNLGTATGSVAGGNLWNGAGAFVGSSNGTFLAIAEGNSFAGNFADWQITGVSMFKVASTGDITSAGGLTLAGTSTTTLIDGETYTFTSNSNSDQNSNTYNIIQDDDGDGTDDLVGISMNLQNNSDDVGDTIIGLKINNTDTAANHLTDALISLDNLETSAVVTDAIIVNATGNITDGLDASATNITNAINIGANNIAGTKFSVDGSTGVITSGSGNEVLTLSTGKIDSDAITLTTSGTTGGTASNSGLEVISDGLTLLRGCADNEILKYTDAGGWACSTDVSSGSLTWDSIGDPAGAGSVTFQDGETSTFIYTTTAGDQNAFEYTINQTDDANATDNFDAMRFNLSSESGDAGDTFDGLVINWANGTANTVMDSAIKIDNAETTTGTMTDGILITSSGVGGGVIDAIDVSDSNITNAINIGANAIAGTNFAVDASGNIDMGGALTAGSGNIVVTNSTGYVQHDALVDCADGEILKWATGGSRWGCSSDINGGSITANTLDFTELKATLALDTTTTFGFGASTYDMIFSNDGTGNEIHNLTSTGDLLINDNGTTFATFDDAGGITFAPNGTSDITMTLDTDSSLNINGANLILNNTTLTDDGQAIDLNITLNGDANVDTVSGLNIDVTSANTGDADVLSGINIGNLSSADATVIERGLTIGTGWDEAIRASGNVVIGAQSDSASTGSSTALTNSAAGTFGSQNGRDKVSSSVVFRGKLFVATSETDGAGVYRYDGGTTWTLVTNSTPGKAITGDTANIDAFVMTVYNDALYIGSQTGHTTNTGAVYYSSTADTTLDSFTMLNATRGTFADTLQDGVADMAVYNGSLIISTLESADGEIVRWDGGTTFTQITQTDGRSSSTDTGTDKDGFLLKVYNGMLISGGITSYGAAASTTAIVAAYQGNGTTWTHLHGTTGGGAFGVETNAIDISGMAVYDGSLYIATAKANAAAVYMYKGTTPVANVAANFIRVNTTVGKLISGDTANIDSITLGVYNGRLYAGSQTAAGDDTGALYEYPQAGVGATEWTLMNTTRGTFGAQTGVNSISVFQEFNGTLYIGTDEGANGLAGMYTWSKTAQNSFGLLFDSGSSNYGKISFIGNRQSIDNNGHFGTFNFSHAVTLSTGAFDYAEDYPTYDATLEPGDVVAIDPNNVDYVIRADGTTPAIGIYSKNPGLRLQKPKDVIDTGETWVPIALVGRVPLKVSTENGPIESGDSLTLSDTIPGVAMKATKAGNIIAQALSGYNGEGVGTVNAFLNNSYITGAKFENLMKPVEKVADDGAITIDHPEYSGSALLAQLISDNQPESITDPVTGEVTVKAKVKKNLSDIFADRIASSMEIVTPSIISDNLSINTITANKITLLSKNKEVLTLSYDDVDTLNKSLVAMGVDVTSLKASLADITTKLSDGDTKQGDMSDRLKVLEDMIATNAFSNSMLFNVPPVFNSDTAGFAVVKKGSRKVEVTFTNPYIAQPIVNATISFEDTDNVTDAEADTFFADDIKSLIINKSQNGFTIILNKNATRDTKFSWTALQVKDAKIFESVIPGLTIDPIESTPAQAPAPAQTPSIDPVTPTDPGQNNPDTQPTVVDPVVAPTEPQNTNDSLIIEEVKDPVEASSTPVIEPTAIPTATPDPGL